MNNLVNAFNYHYLHFYESDEFNKINDIIITSDKNPNWLYVYPEETALITLTEL